jgi:alpha-L-rhamnosidase
VRLTATPGRWDTEVTTAYQWLRNGAAIRGATGRTYTLGAADVGTRVSVRVTATPTVGAAGSATSRSTTVVQRAVSRTTVKVTRKTLRRGQKETVVIIVSGAGAATSGQVRIWRPGAKPVVRALSHGTVRLTFKVKGHGRAKVSAQYLGNGVLAPGARTTVTYRVR